MQDVQLGSEAVPAAGTAVVDVAQDIAAAVLPSAENPEAPAAVAVSAPGTYSFASTPGVCYSTCVFLSVLVAACNLALAHLVFELQRVSVAKWIPSDACTLLALSLCTSKDRSRS
jgi:hypothetical protein